MCAGHTALHIQQEMNMSEALSRSLILSGGLN